MQDPKNINISTAVIGNGKTYSIEHHEDTHITKVKVVDNQGVATYHNIGAFENNVIEQFGAAVNTDTTSLYKIRAATQRIDLTRTLSSDVDFVLQADVTTDRYGNALWMGSYGILTIKIVFDVTGTGGIKLHYKNLLNNDVHILSGTHLTSGEVLVTFGYYGTEGIQLIAATHI